MKLAQVAVLSTSVRRVDGSNSCGDSVYREGALGTCGCLGNSKESSCIQHSSSLADRYC